MAETQLITLDDIRVYRDVDPTYNTDRINNFVMEVQRRNLRELLGQSLYLDMFDNFPDGGIYDDLVNGKNYIHDAETIKYYGLKPAIVYWWLAIVTREGDLFISNYGNVNFTNNPQQTYEISKEKNNIFLSYMESANSYANDIKKFLNENDSDYPLWEGKCEKNNTKFVMFRP